MMLAGEEVCGIQVVSIICIQQIHVNGYVRPVLHAIHSHSPTMHCISLVAFHEFVSVWTFRKLRPTWVWSGALMLRWHDVLAGIWGTQSEVCEPL